MADNDKSPVRRLSHAEWVAEGTALFGPAVADWRWVCPVCAYVTSIAEWRDAGAPEGAYAFSCVGRWLPEAREAFARGPGGRGKGPCNYAGGGLFKLNPVIVRLPNGEDHQVFEWATPDVLQAATTDIPPKEEIADDTNA